MANVLCPSDADWSFLLWHNMIRLRPVLDRKSGVLAGTNENVMMDGRFLLFGSSA